MANKIQRAQNLCRSNAAYSRLALIWDPSEFRSIRYRIENLSIGHLRLKNFSKKQKIQSNKGNSTFRNGLMDKCKTEDILVIFVNGWKGKMDFHRHRLLWGSLEVQRTSKENYEFCSEIHNDKLNDMKLKCVHTWCLPGWYKLAYYAFAVLEFHQFHFTVNRKF